MPPGETCPTMDELLAFTQGVLEDDRAVATRAHVAACEHCAAAVAEAARGLAGSAGGMNGEPEERADDALQPGRKLGRYSILELLGKGAMGAVYAAYDPQLDRRVAVKVLRPDGRPNAQPGEMQQRLLREAQTMARLRHSNVLAIHDTGSFEGGIFLAMDLIAGGTLRDWLKKAPRTPAEVLDVFRQAGEGLAAAHRAGIVHRDFKTDNILVDEGRIFVTDFGVARLGGDRPRDALPDGPSPLSLTRTGAMVGTPAYMSPEQLDGKPADARSDIFAFCVALYEALYGEHPFPARDLAGLRRAIAEGRVPEPSARKGVPAQIERVLLRGLKVAPADRFQTMDELLRALRVDGGRRAWLAGGAALLALLAAGGVFGAKRLDERRLEACSVGDGRLDHIFDSGRQEVVQAAFAQSGSPSATVVFASVRGGLTSAVRAIAAGRSDACASHARGDTSADLFDRRMQCLDERTQDLAALVDTLAKADTTAVEKAVNAVEQLGNPAACADRRRLLEASPLPASAEARARISQVGEEVAKIAALHRAGNYREGLARSAGVVEAAQKAGYAPLDSEALYWRGRLLFDGNEQPRAPEALTAAAAAAVRARRDDLAAQAESQLVLTLGWAQKTEDALRWAEHARAVVARGGDDSILLADLLLARGRALTKVFRGPEAIVADEQALALLEKHARDAPARFVEALAAYAVALGTSGRYKDAVAADERALPLAEQTFGPLHPTTLSIRSMLGIGLTNDGQRRRALPILRRTLDDRRAVLGPDHLDVARVHGQIGSVLHQLGDHEGSAASFKEAIAIAERKLGKDQPEIVFNVTLLSEPLARLGRFAEAYATVDRAEALARKHQGEKSSLLGFIVEARASALEAEGRFAEAARVYSDAAARLEISTPGHPDIANCRGAALRQQRRAGHAREVLEAHTALLAAREKQVGASSADLVDMLVDVGEDLVALGREGEAVPHFERALALVNPDENDPLNVAELRFSAARALWPSQPKRALDLALSAKAALAASPLPRGTLRQDIQRWLAGKVATR